MSPPVIIKQQITAKSSIPFCVSLEINVNECVSDTQNAKYQKLSLIHIFSSFCAALAGVVFSFYTLAGYSLQNMGLELDAISSAVIGGTLLTGGVGSIIGTAIGVLIQGIIQTIVIYQNLNTWWTKVTIAALLCIFIVIQRIISIRAEKAKGR